MLGFTKIAVICIDVCPSKAMRSGATSTVHPPLPANALGSHCIPAKEAHSGIRGREALPINKDPSVVAPPVVIMWLHKRWKCPHPGKPSTTFISNQHFGLGAPEPAAHVDLPRLLISPARLLNIGRQRVNRQKPPHLPYLVSRWHPARLFLVQRHLQVRIANPPSNAMLEVRIGGDLAQTTLNALKKPEEHLVVCTVVNVERVEVQWASSRWASAPSRSRCYPWAHDRGT